MNYLRNVFLLTFITVFPLLLSCSQKIAEKKSKPSVAVFDSCFKQGLLDKWYPLAIDSAGGYFSNLSYKWDIDPLQPKMLVTQSRHIWTSSQAALFYNDSSFNKYARHGVNFLINCMWDKKYGGFFNLRSRNGGYLDQFYKDEKRAYGNSFAIYGLTSYYNLTKDSVALDYAKKTFLWLEKYSHDKQNGGYIDILDQDGTWISRKQPAISEDRAVAAWKDYNSSIHILESFTELYKVWPDSLVKARLQEMLFLIRDTFVGNKGYLSLYFSEDWKPLSNKDSSASYIRQNSYIDHVSFGHDVETAFLMLEASLALGIENDSKTLKVAKELVDHSLATGFDKKYGGFFYEGYYFKDDIALTIINKEKSWWVQAEGLNALLLMSQIFNGEKKYYDAFLKQWEQIEKYVIDPENGDWFISGLDYNREAKTAPKASIWKANYHNGRALMNCIRMLKGENEVVDHFKVVKI